MAEGDMETVQANFTQMKAVVADIEASIRDAVRSGASDAHVPALIKQVQKIPYTRSGKKVELAVRDLIAGTEPKNVGALQDPDAFDEYREMAATWKS